MKKFTIILAWLFYLLPDSSAQGTWTHFTKDEGLTSIWVQSIVEDPQGNVWFGTYKGLNKYDGSTLESFTKKDGLPDDNIQVLAVDAQGMVWIGTKKGLCMCDGNRIIPYAKKHALSENKITQIFKDDSGHLWIGGEFSNKYGFLYEYDGDSLISFNKVAGNDMKPVHKIAQGNQGEIWVFTKGKKDDFIFRYMDHAWVAYGSGPGLPVSNYKSLREIDEVLFDQGGDVWCASCERSIDGKITGHGCLMRFDGEQWKTYSNKDGYQTGFGISSLAEDKDGNIWVGNNKGASRFDGSQWTNYTKQSQIPVFFVISMVKDKQENLWLGTAFGVLCNDGSDWIEFDKDLITGRAIQKVFADSRDHIWIGAGDGLSEGGVAMYDGEKWDCYTARDVFGPFAFDFFEDSGGNVWAITKSGISKYQY